METLRHQDWLALHDAILHLNGAENLAALPGRVLAATRRVIPLDTASLQDDRGGTKNIPWVWIEREPWVGAENNSRHLGVRAMTDYELSFEPLRDAFFACSAEHHPHTAYFRQTGDGSARRISDVMPTGDLFRSRFFHEISRPMGLRWQLTVYDSLERGGTLFLAACRRRTQFSDRDVTMLDLLRPHMAGVWKQTLARERYREQFGAGVVIDDGPAARGALRRRFALTEREAEVLVWLAQGKTNAEIGLILDMGVATAKTHVLHIFAKLGCETRTAAARAALETFAR